MPTFEITSPDGQVFEVNAPEGATEEQIIQYAQQNMPKVETNPTSRIYTPEKGKIKQDVKDLLGGAVRGAGSIGATIGTLGNVLTAGNKPDANRDVMQEDAQTREAMNQGLQSMGVNTDSLPFGVGKLGTEIAGTAGVPKILSTGAEIANLPRLANSLKSGGFNLGNSTGSAVKDMALRVAGGGAVGAGSVAAVDPVQTGTGAVLGAMTPPVIKGAGKLGSMAGDAAIGGLGVTTGAGGNAVREAFNAGKKGATNFLENMRGSIGFDDVVAKAKQGLMNMKIEKNAQYRSGMIDISKDKSVLDFAPIDKVVKEVSGMGSYKGVQVNKNASSTVEEVVDKVNQWKSLDPAEYHTPEGLDALKQAIGDIRDTTQPSTSARRAVDQVYNSIKDEITKQAPVYSDVMKNYANSAQTINELERSLSLGNKPAVDTSVRKLQSVLRNNAQTSYGNRQDMVNLLQEQGGVDVMPDLAGQALNSWTPRGMVGAFEKFTAPFMVFNAPSSIAALPLASPRLVGETAYKAGSLLGGAGRGAKAVNDAISMNGLLSVPQANYLPLSILEAQRNLR